MIVWNIDIEHVRGVLWYNMKFCNKRVMRVKYSSFKKIEKPTV